MKIGRKSIEKEIVKELTARLTPLGWSLLKSDTNYFAKKYNEDIRWGFTFSLCNRCPYSCFFKVYIAYTKFTAMIKSLLMNTPEADFIQDIGLVSSKIPQKAPILSISELQEVPQFVDNLIDILNKSEQEFWLPYSNIENTINGFKQENHISWPVSNLSQFTAHMVCFGIENNRLDIVNMAKEKVKKLLETGNYERDRSFVISVINAAEKMYFCMK
ncbi:hypothetical protein [Treponema pedis]|uniref:hypothetical protein n=1 Tax=Treponema pedis TaxID=409322 RepID=UPI0004128B2C|nr:hypothetical protein [Treponema pedis]